MVYVLISVSLTYRINVGGVVPAFLKRVIVTSVLLQFNKFFQVIFLHPSSTYIQNFSTLFARDKDIRETRKVTYVRSN